MSDDGGWDEFAEGWDDDPAAVAYSAAAYHSLELALRERDRTLDGMRVLDFGCGTGLLTQRLVDRVATIDAMDTSPAMLEVLRKKADRVRWAHVHTLTELPSVGAYDLTVASSVCSFLDDYPGSVVRLASLLAAGGTFIQWDWERDPAEDDPHGLTRAEVSDALTAAGLEMAVVETAFEVIVGESVMEPLIGIGSKPTR